MLRFNDDLSADLQVGFAMPEQTYLTIVRFSNAAGSGKPDFATDLRGIALRIQVDDSTSIDLLATNFPVSHARNARQFVEFAKATAGGNISRILGVASLARSFGIRETARMLCNVAAARKQPVDSVATQTYWSRGALTWGPELAVRYLLRPAPGAPQAPKTIQDRPNYLSTEAGRRLDHGDIRFELCIQRYVDDKVTPIEDTAVEWKEKQFSRRAGRDPDHRAEPTSPRPMPRPARPRSTPRLQPVEHHRGLPPAWQPQPRPQGGLRRQRGAPSQTRWRTETPLRNRVLGALAARALLGDQPPRPVVPAAAALSRAQPRRLPPRAAASEPHRHRAA